MKIKATKKEIGTVIYALEEYVKVLEIEQSFAAKNSALELIWKLDGQAKEQNRRKENKKSDDSDIYTILVSCYMCGDKATHENSTDNKAVCCTCWGNCPKGCAK